MPKNKLIIVVFLSLTLLNCCDNQVEPDADWFVNRVQPYWFGVPTVSIDGDKEEITIGIKEGRWLINTTTVGGPGDRAAVVDIYNISGSLDWVVEISHHVGNQSVFNVFRLVNDEPHAIIHNASMQNLEDNNFSPIRIIDRIQ